VFYQNQMQINGGKNDGSSPGPTPAADHGLLRANAVQPAPVDVAEFVLCDNFFQGAFGGSFLNHQYLIAPPRRSIRRARLAGALADRHAAKRRPGGPAPEAAGGPGQRQGGPPKFGPSALTPDGYAVNTMAPPYWPTAQRDPARPDYALPASPTCWCRRRTSTSATS
jgi:hypothetical protein